jgi:hypothetical protein
MKTLLALALAALVWRKLKQPYWNHYVEMKRKVD